MGWVFLVVVLGVLAAGGWAWDQWDRGVGIVGDFKREIRAEEAKQRARRIAEDAQQRIRNL